MNERGDITTDITKIQRNMRDYYEQLYINELDNLEEMDKLIETYNLQKLNQEEIKSLNRLIMSKEIKSIISNLPTKTKIQEHVASLVNFTNYRINANPSQTLPRKTEERETLSK